MYFEKCSFKIEKNIICYLSTEVKCVVVKGKGKCNQTYGHTKSAILSDCQ